MPTATNQSFVKAERLYSRNQVIKVRVSDPQKELIRRASGGNMSAFLLRPALEKAAEQEANNAK